MRAAANSWTSCFERALDWIYPVKCPLCGLLSDFAPCNVCASEMVLGVPDFIAELSGGLEFRACTYAYEGRAAQAVRRLKFSRSTALAGFMADRVTERIQEIGDPRDLLIPVPMHVSRHRWRGFNQAELLCGGEHELEYAPEALRRVKGTRPQSGLNLDERQRNLKGAFAASSRVNGRSVLLVDDVVTSGFTARACAEALRSAGAVAVGIVAFAGNLE